MATLAIEHIVQDEKGRPVIAGTRLRVSQVAEYIRYDWTVDHLIEQFVVTPGQVYAALSYYHDHKAEIDAQIREEEAFAERMLAEGHAIRSEDLRARIEARMRGESDEDEDTPEG
jgi:uncharacterized protein (DUF433 family)